MFLIRNTYMYMMKISFEFGYVLNPKFHSTIKVNKRKSLTNEKMCDAKVEFSSDFYSQWMNEIMNS